VIDGETGFLLPPGDALAWRAKLLEVISWTSEERARHVAGARARAAAVYNWDRVTQATLAILSGTDGLTVQQAVEPASG
jgi:phosphatidyl-myo-inositol dimannoside synthase